MPVSTIPLASAVSGTLPDGNAPSGSIVQVVQTFSNTIQTITGTSFVELTSLNASITPTSSTNRILVVCSISFGSGNDVFPAFRMFRGATWIGQSTSSGPATQTTFGCAVPTGSANAFNQMGVATYTFLDSPATTSSTTYSVQASPMRTGSRTFVLNAAQSIGDANQLTATSTLTLYEVVA
jgi:hypothetical protein